MAQLSVGMRRSAWAVSALVGELLESLTGDLIGPETTPGLAKLALLGRSLRFLFWPCLDRPLSGLSEGTHTRPSSGQDCPLSKTYIANFVFFPRANRSTNGLPQARKILSAMVWFRLHSVLRIWPLLDRWSANTFRYPGRKQVTRVIPLFSDHRHNYVAKSFIANDLVPPPPWFLR